jgi:DNA-binding NarL/FixJ family response regulator
MSESAPPKRVSDRLWVDIDSRQDVVIVGLRSILETMLGESVFTTVGPVDGEPDVILYDVLGLRDGDSSELDRLHQESGSMVLAVSYQGLRPDLEALALEHGAAAVIPLSISAEELVSIIQAAGSGHLEDIAMVRTPNDMPYPGKDEGLSPRESEVLALIVQGRSNEEIAQGCFLSINSVKTYIRSTYRKIGVRHRAQAVVWAIQHGFVPPAG